MNQFRTFISISVLLAIFSFSQAQATLIQVSMTEPKQVAQYSAGVGSKVTLTLADGTQAPGMFLGSLVHPSGKSDQYLFLDFKKTRIYLVPKKEVTWRFKGAPQPVLDPYIQTGGTCASYAMFDYFLQLNISKTVQSPVAAKLLANDLSTEEGRTQLLANTVNLYYLERRSHTTVVSVMNKIAKNYGLKCKSHSFKTNKEAIQFLKTNLDVGNPVTVEFYTGPDMVNSSYEVQNYQSLSPEDPRLWVPRQIGQRESGGHTIVLAASFYNGTRFKAISIDSDWSEPRIWDVANYLNPRTDMKTVEFTTCK